MNNSNAVNVKYIDPDGLFLVLEIIDQSQYKTEVLIDKQAFKFTSEKQKYAILTNSISSINFIASNTNKSLVDLVVNLYDDKTKENSLKTIGSIDNSDDKEMLAKFFRSINIDIKDN